MPDIIFQIENGEAVTVSARPGDNLLECARGANIAIDAPCSGNGSCGKCRVRLLEGALDGVQTGHISDADYAAGWRLACASRVAAEPACVLVPDIASAYQSRIKTADLSDESEVAVFTALQERLRAAGVGVRHGFGRVSVSMDAPTLEDTLPDAERLENALKAALGREDIRLTFPCLQSLSSALRRGGFSVTALYVETDGGVEILGVFPAGEAAGLCGAAIDIGTTTVSGVLFDLETGEILSKASAGNGQIRYGADVINRIVEQNKPGGRARLRDAIVRETLRPLLRLLLAEAGVEKEQAVRLAIAGNTTMNHLLLGAEADPLRMEPYIPTFFHCAPLTASELGLPVNPRAEVLLAPNIGSYVGGDITAGAMSSMIWNSETFSLFIDLGTNGELVFGNNEFLMSCACSAGPAFEGGDISCGMRATDGAIEAVRIDRESLEPELRIVGRAGQKAVGVCGSGIIDVVAELYRCAVIDARGKFIRSGERVRTDAHGTGRYVLVDAPESETGREISISEIDIESFIRAKGAIYSAIDTMLATLDMTPEVIDDIYVAGGIGSGIDVENAVRIGMFPDIDRKKFHYIGNSSLAGAYAMARSDEAARKVAEIAGNMTYLELSTYPGYMDRFVAACFLPHTDATLFPSSRQEN